MDSLGNVCICTTTQMQFIAVHYPEHYRTPVDILMWLYDMAVYKEEEAKSYAAPKGKSGAGKKGKKAQVEELSEEEDTDFGVVKTNKKKK